MIEGLNIAGYIIKILNWPRLEYTLGGNLVVDYMVAILVFLVALGVFKIFREYLLRRLARLAKKTATDVDVTLIEVIRKVRPPFYFFLAVYVALLSLNVPARLEQLVNYTLLILVAYQVASATCTFIDFLVQKKLAREKAGQTQSALFVMARIVKGGIWVTVVIFVLSNMGVNITSFVATLGIGGVAVALALQNILTDLFSAFSIYFDKPFEVGDFIMVGEHMGTVEHIGIKSTRLRSLQGEEIVMSNQELTSVRVQNFKQLRERRAVFQFGLKYDTPREKLERVPEILKEIIEELELTRIDRAHFFRFGESALECEVVYYMMSPEYNDYMDAQQRINLELKQRLESEGIGFAFPTRVVYQRE